jgi:N-acetylglucosaminyldiphosphoundecaprenol N-acetyl-beta-D-mannosaminyltransferase
MKFNGQRPYINILGVQVEPLDMERAVARVEETLRGDRKGYVCLIGVHGIMEAQRNLGLAATYAAASIAVPDGMPTVWVGRWQGHRGMQRVAGPDLMLEIFRRKEFAGYRHFLYGGKEGVAEELAASFAQRFPWARIVGTYTPPYRELSPDEEEEVIAAVRDVKPDVIWVGIGAPKQEQFMSRYLSRLDTKLMFGVGAAFDYHTGRIQDCSEWIKRAGLQWLHRLIQDPRHLWWRYLRNNPAFVWKIALQMAGVRRYSKTPVFQGVDLKQTPLGMNPQILHKTGSGD